MSLNWLVLMVKNAASGATNHGDAGGAALVQGEGDAHIVIPRVVEPYGTQDEHGQGNEEATETHRIQISNDGLEVEA